MYTCKYMGCRLDKEEHSGNYVNNEILLGLVHNSIKTMFLICRQTRGGVGTQQHDNWDATRGKGRILLGRRRNKLQRKCEY
jgi:hypothetical protein